MPDDTSATAGRHVTNEPTPYAQVPEDLLYDPSLSDKAIRVYAVLRRHGDDPANCYPSKRRLADLMGCSPASIGRPIKELEDAGWLQRVARFDPHGAPTSNGYFVHSSRTFSAAPLQESEDHAHDSATPAQENDDPPRTDEGRTPAQVRAKREPVERKPLNESSVVALAAPTSDIAVREMVPKVLDAAMERAKDAGSPILPSERRRLVSWVHESLAAGYDPSDLATAIASAEYRTPAGVGGALGSAKRKRSNTSVGARIIEEGSDWLKGQSA